MTEQPAETPELVNRVIRGDTDALSELFPGALNPADEFYIGRIWGVGEVVQGTLQTPDFLDDEMTFTPPL